LKVNARFLRGRASMVLRRAHPAPKKNYFWIHFFATVRDDLFAAARSEHARSFTAIPSVRGSANENAAGAAVTSSPRRGADASPAKASGPNWLLQTPLKTRAHPMRAKKLSEGNLSPKRNQSSAWLVLQGGLTRN
jgi:hypothetical protein